MMKSSLLLVPVVVGSMLAATGASAAERYQSGPAETPRTAKIAQAQTRRIAKSFNLNQSQSDSVLGIMTKADMQTQSLRQQLKPMRATLKNQIESNQPDRIAATLQQMSPLQLQAESIRAAAAAKIYATVLTPSQRQQAKGNFHALFGVPGFQHSSDRSVS